ncbi:MAG: 4Fe-4S binding protein [Micropruina sp.]|nr:4Fe-4S binding protein [Micropruina sp.]
MPSDRSPDLLRWLGAIDPPELAVIACQSRDVPTPPAGVVVVRLTGCVTAESLGLPAQLLASGVRRVEVLPCDQDADGHDRVLASWSRAIPELTTIAEPPHRRPGRRRGSVYDLAGTAFARRSAFGLRVPSPALDLDADAEERGVSALRLLADQGRAQLSPDDQPASAPVGARLLADGCTACGVCVRACPHDALELIADGDALVLRHHAHLCRADTACVRLCPQQALSVGGSSGLVQLAQQPEYDLARVSTVACPRCGTRHPRGEGALCRPCAFRAEHAFGSVVPASPPSQTGR